MADPRNTPQPTPTPDPQDPHPHGRRQPGGGEDGNDQGSVGRQNHPDQPQNVNSPPKPRELGPDGRPIEEVPVKRSNDPRRP